MTPEQREQKRARDRKYYASYKGRINRWRKGEFDARDDKVRSLARSLGYTVTFTSVDDIKLTKTSFRGSVYDAYLWLQLKRDASVWLGGR